MANKNSVGCKGRGKGMDKDKDKLSYRNPYAKIMMIVLQVIFLQSITAHIQTLHFYLLAIIIVDTTYLIQNI